MMSTPKWMPEIYRTAEVDPVRTVAPKPPEGEGWWAIDDEGMEEVKGGPFADKKETEQWIEKLGEDPYHCGSITHMSGGDWFCPAYGIPDDAKEQIYEWGKTLPWDESAKIQDPNKYHITSFYSPHGFAHQPHHEWVQSESGMTYPAYTHSLDSFTGHDPNKLVPVVMRFHAPELSQHAERMMDEGEQRGLGVARFDGGHKPHITLGHNPEGFPIQPPRIDFQTTPLHELHSYYDSLK